MGICFVRGRCKSRGSLSGRRPREVTIPEIVFVITVTSCGGIEFEICIKLLLGLELAEFLAPGSIDFSLGVVVCATAG